MCDVYPIIYLTKPDEINDYFTTIRAIKEYAQNMVDVPLQRADHATKLRELAAA